MNRKRERIPEILKRFEKIWLKSPGMRFGQLFLNVFSLHNGIDSRVYNMEDDILIKNIEKFYEFLDDRN